MIVSDCADCGEYQYLPFNRLCSECLVRDMANTVNYVSECSRVCVADLEGAVSEDYPEYEVIEQGRCIHLLRDDEFGGWIENGEVVVVGESIQDGQNICDDFEEILSKIGVRFGEFTLEVVEGIIEYEGNVRDLLEETDGFTFRDEQGQIVLYAYGTCDVLFDTTDENDNVEFRADDEELFRESVRKFTQVTEDF